MLQSYPGGSLDGQQALSDDLKNGKNKEIESHFQDIMNRSPANPAGR